MIKKIMWLYEEKKLNPLIIAGQYFFFSIVLLSGDFFTRVPFMNLPFVYEIVIPLLLLVFSVLYAYSTIQKKLKLKRFCIVALQATFAPLLFIFLFWAFLGHVTLTWVLASGFFLFGMTEALMGEYND
ncbi:hypothetical protein [Listeria fleischmannii]|uniref:hypothetical protein n=1 Tax=Listeria fleischmannii TaxID=1069827 RepID=UPI00162950DB|nr:hypothetical protein [Listeria fleischmannii]MBC1420077.1 hypothetical protein [Listeria fleischmannii]